MLSASPSASFCYRCCKWFPTTYDWSKHCEWHLGKLVTRCEVYTYRNTLLIPGICLFCIGCEQLPPAERFHQWISSAALWRHVNKHLRKVSWPRSCPHPLCNLEIGDRELFNHHLVDTHGKASLSMDTLKRKRREQDEGTEDNEATSDVDQVRKRPKLGKKRNRPGESIFRNVRSIDDAFIDIVRSTTLKSEASVRSPITPRSLARTLRSSSCPPTGTHSAVIPVELAISKDAEVEIQGSSAAAASSSASPATTPSYCGVDYAIDNSLEGGELEKA